MTTECKSGKKGNEKGKELIEGQWIGGPSEINCSWVTRRVRERSGDWWEGWLK